MDYSCTKTLREIFVNLCLEDNPRQDILSAADLPFKVVGEMKDNLAEMPNDSSRIAYIKTTLLKFTDPGIESYIKELVIYYDKPTEQNTKEIIGNKIISNATHRQKMLIKFSRVRNSIIFELAEHLQIVYPDIDYSKLFTSLNINTKDTFFVLNADNKTELSAYEIALMHYYLHQGREAEPMTPVQVGKHYGALYKKSPDNITKYSREIDKRRRKNEPLGNVEQLKNVINNLKKYPQILKAATNDLDQIS